VPADEVLLAPAAAGLALASALGMVAFEVDLPGYRFGWRQVLSALAALCVVGGIIPAVGGSVDGRWGMPSGDYSRTLGRLEAEQSQGPFRVLWLGDPDVLPLAGWDLGNGLAYATSEGLPRAQSLWAGSDDGSTRLISDALALATDRQTARLGRLLAPMGIRYVVVPERLAPSPFEKRIQPVPPDLTFVLGGQLDLHQLDLDAAVTVYLNEAAAPTRAELPAGTSSDGLSVSDTAALDLSTSAPALPETDGYATYRGPVHQGRELYLSASSSQRWQLREGGHSVQRLKGFGWANAFPVSADGDATLRFRTPPLRYAFLALQALLWLIALRGLLRMRLGPRKGSD
jgi:hypothetical protein